MLDHLFGSGLRASVLTWLYSNPGKRYYVRQLEKLLDRDSTNLSRELARLEEAGVVRSRREGRQKYFEADGECPIYDALREMVRNAADPAVLIAESLRAIEDSIAAAFLVHGTEDGGEGDFVLFVIGSCSRIEVSRRLARVNVVIGREVGFEVYSRQRWSSLYESGVPNVRAAAASKKVFVAGDEESLAAVLVRRRVTDAIESWIGGDNLPGERI